MRNADEIQEEVEEFESDNEQTLALIEQHKDEEGFTDALLTLVGISRDDYDEYLDMKSAVEEGIEGPLVPDHEWVGYVEEMLEDLGEVKVPDYVVVDWEATAANVQQDYSSVDIGGTTYWWGYR